MPAYKKSGFTLVELLVVITIIAILSVIGVTVFTGIQKNARDTARRGDIEAIGKAFEVKFDGIAYGDLSPDNNKSLFASGAFPKDPRGGDYTVIANGTSTNAVGFTVCTALESNPNPTCSTPSDTCICKSSVQGGAPNTAGSSSTVVAITNPESMWTPKTLAGLQLWLKADVITNVSNGSPISSWTDSSGKGNNASGVASYQASAINNLQSVRTTAGQTLRITTNFPPPYTVLYVARQNGPTRGRVLSALNNWLLGWWAGGRRHAYFDGWVSPGGLGADSGVYLYTAIGTGSLSTVYENGTQFASNANGLSGPNGLVLGGWAASEYSDADFAEVIIYNQALSDTDRKKVEQYLGSKYGITIQ